MTWYHNRSDALGSTQPSVRIGDASSQTVVHGPDAAAARWIVLARRARRALPIKRDPDVLSPWHGWNVVR